MVTGIDAVANCPEKDSMRDRAIELSQFFNQHLVVFLLVEPVVATIRNITLAPKKNAMLKFSLMLR